MSARQRAATHDASSLSESQQLLLFVAMLCTLSCVAADDVTIPLRSGVDDVSDVLLDEVCAADEVLLVA